MREWTKERSSKSWRDETKKSPACRKISARWFNMIIITVDIIILCWCKYMRRVGLQCRNLPYSLGKQNTEGTERPRRSVARVGQTEKGEIRKRAIPLHNYYIIYYIICIFFAGWVVLESDQSWSERSSDCGTHTTQPRLTTSSFVEYWSLQIGFHTRIPWSCLNYFSQVIPKWKRSWSQKQIQIYLGIGSPVCSKIGGRAPPPPDGKTRFGR